MKQRVRAFWRRIERHVRRVTDTVFAQIIFDILKDVGVQLWKWLLEMWEKWPM